MIAEQQDLKTPHLEANNLWTLAYMNDEDYRYEIKAENVGFYTAAMHLMLFEVRSQHFQAYQLKQKDMDMLTQFNLWGHDFREKSTPLREGLGHHIMTYFSQMDTIDSFSEAIVSYGKNGQDAVCDKRELEMGQDNPLKRGLDSLDYKERELINTKYPGFLCSL